MAFKYPLDTEELQKERMSYQSLFYKFDMKEWVPNGSDHTDHGMDYGFEYIEGNEYKGFRLLSQIKSTEHIEKKDDVCIFDLKITTAVYAIHCSQPFVLFLVDLKDDDAYYVCLQEHFIKHPEMIDKVQKNKSTIRIKIPINNIVSRDNTDLKRIAKEQFTFDEESGIRKIR